MATAFEELAGSPIIRFDSGAFTATRRLLVDWDDALSFLVELYGGYRSVGSEFSYSPPASFPGVEFSVVTGAQIEPFPADNPSGDPAPTLDSDTNRYAKALVTVTYGIPFDNDSRPGLPSVPAGTFLTYRADLGLESVAVPGRVWQWAVDSAALADDVRPTLITPAEDFSLTWYRVPLPPWDAIRDVRGHVNDDVFLNYPAGTVMFQGAITRRDFQLLDPPLWRLAYHFKVRTVQSTASSGSRFGWNHHYRRNAASGEHWLEIADQDGNRPYAAASFTDLFQFPV